MISKKGRSRVKRRSTLKRCSTLKRRSTRGGAMDAIEFGGTKGGDPASMLGGTKGGDPASMLGGTKARSAVRKRQVGLAFRSVGGMKGLQNLALNTLLTGMVLSHGRPKSVRKKKARLSTLTRRGGQSRR